MSRQILAVLLGGREIGQIRWLRRHRLTFAYEQAWRCSDEAYPLSLSLPLAAAEHEHEPVDAFLWGLLPDDQRLLEWWAWRFQISARNALLLLGEVGEDCAGAVQLVRPARVEALSRQSGPAVRWLEDDEVTERLRALRQGRSAWRDYGDSGLFTLAGAQDKTALLLGDDGRWGIPLGRTATTHILKPPMDDLAGSVENEHFCLLLAREVGLPTARSEVRRFGDEIALVIERYDRARAGELAAAAAAEAAQAAARAAATEAAAATMWAVRAAAETAKRAAAASARAAAQAAALAELAQSQPILRLHQEDLCQALGVHPLSKYQSDGGPSPERIVELLRTHSSRPDEDVATFIDALAFSWLIVGTDAHAKNYSLLHGSGGRVRLAPLYDILSALPYSFQEPKLAMQIGGSYRLHDIGLHHWRSFAEGVRLDPSKVVSRISALASRIADCIAPVRSKLADQGLTHPIIEQLSELLAQRAESCLEQLRER